MKLLLVSAVLIVNVIFVSSYPCPKNNVAIGKRAWQSSQLEPALGVWGYNFVPSMAVDGSFTQDRFAHTMTDPIPWWVVDLGDTYTVTSVRYTWRYAFPQWTNNFEVGVTDSPPATCAGTLSSRNDYQTCTRYLATPPANTPIDLTCTDPISGRYVVVQQLQAGVPLNIVELEVFTDGSESGGNEPQ